MGADVKPSSTCNYCFGRLRWLTTAAGQLMPVDAEPDPKRGNVIVIGGKAGVLGPSRARAARASGVQLYLHHAATCPQAAAWNKPTPKPGRPAPRRAVRRP